MREASREEAEPWLGLAGFFPGACLHCDSRGLAQPGLFCNSDVPGETGPSDATLPVVRQKVSCTLWLPASRC